VVLLDFFEDGSEGLIGADRERKQIRAPSLEIADRLDALAEFVVDRPVRRVAHTWTDPTGDKE
jgi:hypothetical protein